MRRVEGVINNFTDSKEVAQTYILNTRRAALQTVKYVGGLSSERIKPMLDVLKEHLGIELTERQLHGILSCYVVIAGQVLNACPSKNTKSRDQLFDAVSLFYLGCKFPIYGDDVEIDIEAYERILKEMITHFGDF